MTSPRDRIRDAALRQFAALGVKGATVRGIAQDAGVSPGLVQHHFPTKRALREACDAYVLTVLRDLRARPVTPDAAFVAGVHEALAPVVPYLATVLVSDSAAAARLFDDLAELNRASLTIPADEDAEAIVAVHTAMELGLAVLAGQIYRRLGAGEHDRGAAARIARARLFLASERSIDQDLEARVRQGVADFEKES